MDAWLSDRITATESDKPDQAAPTRSTLFVTMSQNQIVSPGALYM